MKKLTVFLSLFSYPLATLALDPSRCGPPGGAEREIRQSDFRWNYTLVELLEKAVQIVEGEARLSGRAIWSPQAKAYLMPYSAERGGPVRLPERFIQTVRAHIETSLRMGYVDAILFPDMGHSHFLIPQEDWESDYSKRPLDQMSQTYESFFEDDKMLILYHTAEQLRMKDETGALIPDRHLQWRFFSRNIVGDNRGEGRIELHQNPTHAYNTVGGVPGYRWWGAGFYVTENKNGCFPFVHEGSTRYFDLTLKEMPL